MSTLSSVEGLLARETCARFLAPPVFSIECTTPMMEALHIMREVGATWALVTADAGPEGEATVSAFPQLTPPPHRSHRTCPAHPFQLNRFSRACVYCATMKYVHVY